jgi:hypothetical protein
MRFYTKKHKYYCGIDLHAVTFISAQVVRLPDP